MEIIGSHDNGIVEDNLECLLEIKDGILGVSARGRTNYQELNQPQNEKKWNFRKVNWKESKPVKVTKMYMKGMEWVWKYSHVIEYMTNDNKTQRIFINPNWWQRLSLGWINKKLLVRRITSLEYFIGLVLAFLINIAAAYVYGWLTEKNNDKNGVSPVSTQQSMSIKTSAAKNAGSILDTTTNKTMSNSQTLSPLARICNPCSGR